MNYTYLAIAGAVLLIFLSIYFFTAALSPPATTDTKPFYVTTPVYYVNWNRWPRSSK